MKRLWLFAAVFAITLNLSLFAGGAYTKERGGTKKEESVTRSPLSETKGTAQEKPEMGPTPSPKPSPAAIPEEKKAAEEKKPEDIIKPAPPPRPIKVRKKFVPEIEDDHSHYRRQVEVREYNLYPCMGRSPYPYEKGFIHSCPIDTVRYRVIEIQEYSIEKRVSPMEECTPFPPVPTPVVPSPPEPREPSEPLDVEQPRSPFIPPDVKENQGKI